MTDNMDQRSRTEYECNVLFKLVPPKDVLILAKQQVARRQQENNMSPNDIEKKEKEIVREVFKMLRELINKTKMFTVLMNGKKWMENAVARADRRLERAEKRRRRTTTTGVQRPYPFKTYEEEEEEWNRLRKLPAGEEKQKAMDEHLKMLEDRRDEKKRIFELNQLKRDAEGDQIPLEDLIKDLQTKLIAGKEGMDAEEIKQRERIISEAQKNVDFMKEYDEERERIVNLPTAEERQKAVEENVRKLRKKLEEVSQSKWLLKMELKRIEEEKQRGMMEVEEGSVGMDEETANQQCKCTRHQMKSTATQTM